LRRLRFCRVRLVIGWRTRRAPLTLVLALRGCALLRFVPLNWLRVGSYATIPPGYASVLVLVLVLRFHAARFAQDAQALPPLPALPPLTFTGYLPTTHRSSSSNACYFSWFYPDALPTVCALLLHVLARAGFNAFGCILRFGLVAVCLRAVVPALLHATTRSLTLRFWFFAYCCLPPSLRMARWFYTALVLRFPVTTVSFFTVHALLRAHRSF